MKMQIHITGASGSGATTLAEKLAQKLGVPHFDTDSYLWLPTDPPFTQQRAPSEIINLLGNDLNGNDSLVLSGSVLGWGDLSKYPFSHVVFLDVPTEERLKRLQARELSRLGERILPGGDLHESHSEFLSWAATYDDPASDGRNRVRHEKWLTTVTGKLIRVIGSKKTDEAIAEISKQL